MPRVALEEAAAIGWIITCDSPRVTEVIPRVGRATLAFLRFCAHAIILSASIFGMPGNSCKSEKYGPGPTRPINPAQSSQYFHLSV